MKVLGIENRSENWKTALYFFRLFGEGRCSSCQASVGAAGTSTE